MAIKLDSLDIGVLVALVVAVAAYLKLDAIKGILSSNDSSLSVTSNSRDIVEVLKENNKDYLVIYGSQTGTTEDYAKKFAKELSAKFSLHVMCVDVENYDFDNLNSLPPNVIVSLFLSTYGEGDFPDTTINFEEWLQNLQPGDLDNVRYTLFGFGNSTYEFYNGAAKKAQKLLDEASATIIGNFGMADDGTATTDEDYLSWKEGIMEELKDSLALHEREVMFESSYEYSVLTNGVTNSVSLGEPISSYLPSKKLSYNDEGKQLGPFDASHPYVAPIRATKELMSNPERNCIHVEFDLSGSNMKYSTGDHLGVWPSNPDEKVQKFISTFGLDPEVVFNLRSKDTTMNVPFPVPCTIGAAVRYYLEISGPISRQVLSSICQYVTDTELKEKLVKLSNDRVAFAKEVTSKYFDLADALLYLSKGAKWDTVPWEFLVETVPHLQPRYYSISSSASTEKQTVHITAVVEKFPNPAVPAMGDVTGITTNLLRHIHLSKSQEDPAKAGLPVRYNLEGPRGLYSGFKLPVHVRRSNFRLPSNPATPVIMVGPGTGVAPFRGFIRDRVKQISSQPNVNLGKHILFYGSRNEGDFLYKDEWPAYSKALGNIFELVVAHSRVPGEKKVYVQDRLLEKQAEILELINDGAFIYVCGDAKNMAHDVNQTLAGILSKGKGITNTEALDVLKSFRTTGKYQEDVW